MDASPPPPRPAAAEHLQSLPKLRLMCSYGGYIVPRAHDKALCYVGGENRMVAIDRRTTASSLSALATHLSRTLYNNKPFFLKYQLPDEELDSLISVATDEDLQNMLEEHDRISAAASPTPPRIRLFLFPIKSESVASVLLDPKSDSWFSDALKNTGVDQRGHSSDSGLFGVGSSDFLHVDNSGSVPESLVLETNSSFGSTSSSISMTSFAAVGVQCEEEKKGRITSSAAPESDYSVGSAGKAGISQEPLFQLGSGVSPYAVEAVSGASDPSSMTQMQKIVQVSGYQLPQRLDGKQHQHEIQYLQSGAYYAPQHYPGMLPLSSYHPLQHVQMHQQQHSPCVQHFPIYLVPVQPTQSYNMPVQYNVNAATIAATRTPLALQSATIPAPVAYKDITTAQQIPESTGTTSKNLLAATSLVGSQSQPPLVGPPELQHTSQPVVTSLVAEGNYSNDIGSDLAYSQIYKTQPPGPAFISQCQTMMKGTKILSAECSMQQTNNAKHHAALLPQ